MMLITKCTCGDSRGSFSDVNYEVYVRGSRGSVSDVNYEVYVRGQSRKFQWC